MKMSDIDTATVYAIGPNDIYVRRGVLIDKTLWRPVYRAAAGSSLRRELTGYRRDDRGGQLPVLVTSGDTVSNEYLVAMARDALAALQRGEPPQLIELVRLEFIPNGRRVRRTWHEHIEALIEQDRQQREKAEREAARLQAERAAEQRVRELTGADERLWVVPRTWVEVAALVDKAIEHTHG